MKVGWLADTGNADGSQGGAELTQAEFRAAAPKDVTVVSTGPGALDCLSDSSVVCVFNSVTYPRETIEALEGKRIVRYWNDLAPHGDPVLKLWLLQNATNVFCSPLHLERFPHDHDGGEIIPPAVDLERFRAAQNGTKRKGSVCLGAWANHGKAPHLVAEWARENGGVDFYGGGPLAPPGSTEVAYDDLPGILARYRIFVFLPVAVEPFGRAVVEAWTAGCQIVTNHLVGARYFIEDKPEALETAAEDFWSLVLG